jgi:hypothetical protein
VVSRIGYASLSRLFPLLAPIEFGLHFALMVADVGTARFGDALGNVTELLCP